MEKKKNERLEHQPDAANPRQVLSIGDFPRRLCKPLGKERKRT